MDPRATYKRASVNRETYEPMDFSVIKTEEQAYVLGFLAADGHVSQKDKTISIELATKDLAHLWKLQYLLLGNNQGIHFVASRQNRSAVLHFRSQLIVSQLLEHGLPPRKSLVLQPPRFVPDRLIRHWVRGYFDGDGCVGINRGYPLAKTLGTFSVLQFISDRFAEIYQNGCHIRPKNKIYSLQYGSKAAEVFLVWIYSGANIFLDRKFCIAEPFLDDATLWQRVTEIESHKSNKALPILNTGQDQRLILWAPWEDELIRRHYLTQNHELLLKDLSHRKWKNIRERANFLGLKRLNQKDNWEPKEVDWLLANRNECSMKEITTTLGRTHHTVYRKLREIDNGSQSRFLRRI